MRKFAAGAAAAAAAGAGGGGGATSVDALEIVAAEEAGRMEELEAKFFFKSLGCVVWPVRVTH